jgi:hypothetical protein
VQLAGGLTDLHIATTQIVPDGTQLVYQVQVGGVWYNLGDPAMPLLTAPSLVPLQVVLIGTSDLAPSFTLNPTALTVSRAALAMVDWSEVRNLASSSTNIEVQVVAVGFDAAVHTLACTLLSGATVLLPALTTSRLDPDGVGLRFTFTFDPTAPGITSYAIKIAGTSAVGSAPFYIVERTDVAQ